MHYKPFNYGLGSSITFITAIFQVNQGQMVVHYETKKYLEQMNRYLWRFFKTQ